MTLEFAEPALSGGASRLIDPAFRAHYFTILRLCMRQLGDRSDAEDAAQETFRRALQQREGMIGDPLPWLIAVARNVCIDELRRRRTGRNALERSAAEGNGVHAEGDGSSANPERVVVGRMFVRELLDRLTPAERRVVAGSLIEGQSGGELAASLGVTASTARVLLARARGKLRRYLEDGQGLVTGVCFAGWRTAHWVRQRVLSRPWALQSHAALLLPALVVTAMVSAGGAPAAAGGAAAGDSVDHYVATAHRVDVSSDTVTGRNSTPSTAVQFAPGGQPQGRGAAPASEAGAGSPLDLILPAPDPDQVWVTDFAPSPNYRTDHTIFMVGTGSCSPSCSQLFRSTDGGATWTYVPTHDLQSPQLLIPPSSYGNGRFYAAGGNLLQVTTDNGSHFRNDAPLLGSVTVAPAWLGAQVVMSDVDLSLIDSSQVPHVVATFGPAQSAAGPALLFPSASGFTALQLVQNYLVPGPDTLLSCTTAGCATLATVPLSGKVQLIASPNFDTDHTLFAVGGGVAVSHDGGATFALVSTKPIFQGISIPGPSGVRIVAVDTAYAQNGNLVLMYSDDLGMTWDPATLGRPALGAVYVHTPRLIGPGRLIASAADPHHPGANIFICSDDGASWSGCSA